MTEAIATMSALIAKWLNHKIHLSQKIDNIETDFANGYFFAELLHHLGHVSDLSPYAPAHDDTIEAKVHNFELLLPHFQQLFLKHDDLSRFVDISYLREIMMEMPGRASKLLAVFKDTSSSSVTAKTTSVSSSSSSSSKPSQSKSVHLKSIRPPPANTKRYISRHYSKVSLSFMIEHWYDSKPRDPTTTTLEYFQPLYRANGTRPARSIESSNGQRLERKNSRAKVH